MKMAQMAQEEITHEKTDKRHQTRKPATTHLADGARRDYTQTNKQMNKQHQTRKSATTNLADGARRHYA